MKFWDKPLEPGAPFARLIITGRPITKKNHQEIFRHPGTGRPFVTQSKQYKAYEAAAMTELRNQFVRRLPLEGPLCVAAWYWLEDRRGWPDLCGLLQATGDILEKAKVIHTDKHIGSWDGSRIVGLDKDNPRTELAIYSGEVGSDLWVVPKTSKRARR